MLLDTIAMTIIGVKASELWDGSFAEVIVVTEMINFKILKILL